MRELNLVRQVARDLHVRVRTFFGPAEDLEEELGAENDVRVHALGHGHGRAQSA